MTMVSTNDPQKDLTPDVEGRVIKVIALTKRLPREAVNLDSSFESLGIDSLDRLNILFDLESEFDVEINDEDAKRVENIPQMVAGVRTLLAAKMASTAGGAAALASVETLDPALHHIESSGEIPATGTDAATKPASSGE